MSKNKKNEEATNSVDDINAVVVSELEVVNEEQKKKDIVKKAYMYLGPNVKGGILTHGNVYSDIPKHLKDTINKSPSIEKLFIEVQNVPKFKEDLKNQSTQAFRLNAKAIEELKGE